MEKLCTRGKYLKIKKNTYELLYNTLTLLLKEPRNAGLRKEENRDEGEFRAFNKITFLIIAIANSSISKFSTIIIPSVNISSISNSRIF
jgi:hypothetical protein